MRGTTVGWQSVSNNGSIRLWFRSLRVVVTPRNDCLNFHELHHHNVSSDQFCTTGIKSMDSSMCLSYVGAPLVNNKHQLVGILNYVNPEKNGACNGWYSLPSIYVTICPYTEWIRRISSTSGDEMHLDTSKVREDRTLLYNVLIITFIVIFIIIVVCCIYLTSID